ncbi:MAG: hypothetical protein AAF411_12155 [Myxococcota bacterium]
MTRHPRTVLRASVGALVAAVVSTHSSTAEAFSVKSGFTDGCHEAVTTGAFFVASVELPAVAPDSVPRSNDWRRIFDHLRPGIEPPLDEATRFLLYSLVVGARAPDSEGYSLTNITVLRGVQADPNGQYIHCLRAASDDFDDGNGTALAGCRGVIIDNLSRAFEIAMEDPSRTIEVPITLDEYGSFDTSVAAVPYYIGRALHTFEDSFTHSLRSPDLRRVVHVMNYEAAIADTLDEARDGMAHSGAADSCTIVAGRTGEVVNRERFFAAVEGSADVLRAFARAVAASQSGETVEERLVAELDAVLLKWFQVADPSELGDFDTCTEDNDYCNSPFLETARLEPAGPYLGCSASGIGAPLDVFLFVLAGRALRWGRR